jgi:phospholipid transport system substrate-binding protein
LTLASTANPTRRALLGVLSIAALGRGRMALAAIASPQEFIQELGDRTLAILVQPTPQPEKLSQLKQILDQSTDLELVARLVLGRYWRQATPEQQSEFVKLFNELLMQTMAERMSWYNGQTFEITGAKPVDERDTMVATRILRPSGKPPILVDWRVRENGGSFLLIDILAEGVSLVVTQRAEAADVIGRDGLDGLLGQMRTRLAQRATPS